jgi:hypothetical protein
MPPRAAAARRKAPAARAKPAATALNSELQRFNELDADGGIDEVESATPFAPAAVLSRLCPEFKSKVDAQVMRIDAEGKEEEVVRVLREKWQGGKKRRNRF